MVGIAGGRSDGLDQLRKSRLGDIRLLPRGGPELLETADFDRALDHESATLLASRGERFKRARYRRVTLDLFGQNQRVLDRDAGAGRELRCCGV